MDKHSLKRLQHSNSTHNTSYQNTYAHLPVVTNRRTSHHGACAFSTFFERVPVTSPGSKLTKHACDADEILTGALTQLCRAALVLVAVPAAVLLIPPPMQAHAAYNAPDMAAVILPNAPGRRTSRQTKDNGSVVDQQVDSPPISQDCHISKPAWQHMADVSVLETGPASDAAAAGDGSGGKLSGSAVTGADMMQSLEAAGSLLFKQAMPSVVNISNSRSAQSFSNLDVSNLPQGQASGFIWDTRGHVVAPYHVVKGMHEVKVTLHDYSTFTAKLVGWDASKDVAVLRLAIPKNKLKDLQPVKLQPPSPPLPAAAGGLVMSDHYGASSSGTSVLQVGQPVWGVGNPYGLYHTLTQGFICALGGELPSGPFPIKNVIQTTTASSHQSGGVLINSKGCVIGMLASPHAGREQVTGLGYAVPMETLKGLVDQILLYGKPMRPSLGITFAPPQVLEELRVEGVLVLEVPLGSPAAVAGLRPTHRDIFGDIILGDVVVGMEGRPVRNLSDLFAVLDDRRSGDRVKVDIIRDSKATSLTLVLGERALGSAEE
ncbi:hypothetical protein CEUSTIGMA_g10255.t1 [Chlamydomonas eustigma]|uniref:PDZ domain-containing protein n=1 Tax=Chlamydomonas eustigma TaxID=1157962 RepID=A0A250XIT3_9CHLO|nr:hypothetical protein CEUSTIGMA_g10255.t1 [Chlamydomonas eustigma]|eukprot:GAX82829.1 hypothetical protein CEUSTIGMA_g10255.t1 [Chlamydomonas eustigma]